MINNRSRTDRVLLYTKPGYKLEITIKYHIQCDIPFSFLVCQTSKFSLHTVIDNDVLQNFPKYSQTK